MKRATPNIADADSHRKIFSVSPSFVSNGCVSLFRPLSCGTHTHTRGRTTFVFLLLRLVFYRLTRSLSSPVYLLHRRHGSRPTTENFCLFVFVCTTVAGNGCLVLRERERERDQSIRQLPRIFFSFGKSFVVWLFLFVLFVFVADVKSVDLYESDDL